ncbi:hypothetical protein D3C72_2057880 [compost metagenome]
MLRRLSQVNGTSSRPTPASTPRLSQVAWAAPSSRAVRASAASASSTSAVLSSVASSARMCSLALPSILSAVWLLS